MKRRVRIVLWVFLYLLSIVLTVCSEEELRIPPIYVVNLDRSPERWASISTEIKKAGLDVIRLAAVDGKALSDGQLRNVTTLMSRSLQPRGVIGCYLSHRRFWQTVIDENLPEAIVLEDDVQLVDDFKVKLLQHLQKLDRNDPYDVIMLGAIGKVHPDNRDGVLTSIFSTFIGGTRKFKKISHELYQPVRPAGTHGYMVSNAGARKLLNLCPKATFHVDLDAWRHKSLIIRIFNPMLVYQTFADSSLTDDVTTMAKAVQNSNLIDKKRLALVDRWTKDPISGQTWGHIMAEPLLQFGRKGMVLTVERYLALSLGGLMCSLSSYCMGYLLVSRAILAGVAVWIIGVRAIIFLLMNWK